MNTNLEIGAITSDLQVVINNGTADVPSRPSRAGKSTTKLYRERKLLSLSSKDKRLQGDLDLEPRHSYSKDHQYQQHNMNKREFLHVHSKTLLCHIYRHFHLVLYRKSMVIVENRFNFIGNIRLRVP